MEESYKRTQKRLRAIYKNMIRRCYDEEAKDYTLLVDEHFRVGWNSCIDAIIGE